MRKPSEKKENRIKNTTRFFLRENDGSAIVMVLVAMAFVGIIASMLMYVTFINYKTKIIDRRAKDNFYSAEMAMEEIKTGLERTVNDAFTQSYMEVLQDYGNDDALRQKRFELSYKNRIVGALKEGNDENKYNQTLLLGFVTHPYKDGVGAEVINLEKDNVMMVFTDGVRLKDVTVRYTDEDGYVAIISTDIVLRIPYLGLGNAIQFPPILDYCIIANETLRVDNGSSTIQGNVYGGQKGISLAAGTELSMKAYANEMGETVPVSMITDGNVTVGVSSKQVGETAGRATFTTDANTSLWANGIVVNGGSGRTGAANDFSVKLTGASYIQDDITIGEKGSKISLSGKYYGYGSKANQAENSSSIVINGVDTHLDFTGLEQLMLAGSAYIGTPKTEKGDADNKDIKLGTSVANKAEQLAFLVPIECIGYDTEKKMAVVGKNPVNIQDKVYQDFLTNQTANPDKYQEVNLNVISKVLKKPLSNYGAEFEKVYYKPDADNTWVYYYLKFSSTMNANKFFQDYFAASKKYLTGYMKNYISSFKVGSSVNLDIAGNMVSVTPGVQADGSDTVYTLIPASPLGSVEQQVLSNKQKTQWSNEFIGLCKKLTKDYASLTGKERNANVYQNIINEKKVEEYTNAKTVFVNQATGDKAVLLKKGLVHTDPIKLSEATDHDTNVHLVITDRDVEVDTDFTGLLISKGTVSIKNEVTVKAYDNISQAFVAEYKDNFDKTTRAVGLFRDGIDATNFQEDEDDDVIITSQDMVVYENWTKR